MMARVVPSWNEVYYADATEALIDLCDAVADGATPDIETTRNRIARACEGAWILPGILAEPILRELAVAAAQDRDVELSPYQARLAAVAFKMREPLRVSVAALASLTSEEYAYLLRLDRIEVVVA
jgi:hypothetical protein